MPRANPDYAGITQAAKAIAAQEAHDLDAADSYAADTLSGRTDIVWAHSDTVARTFHGHDDPTVPAVVTHTASFRVTPKALPPVRMEYGVVKFWPETVAVTWRDGQLQQIFVAGRQAKKTGDGLGKDERKRLFRTKLGGGYGTHILDLTKVPAPLRAVIDRYEVKVPVASPSPVVIP